MNFFGRCAGLPANAATPACSSSSTGVLRIGAQYFVRKSHSSNQLVFSVALTLAAAAYMIVCDLAKGGIFRRGRGRCLFRWLQGERSTLFI